MQTTLCLLGRQPAIGVAELESVFGSDAVRPVGNMAVELSVEPKDFSINRLGGTQKATKLLTYLETTRWPELVDYAMKALPEHLDYLPKGKLRLGLSVYGLPVSVRDINTAGLKLKKLATKHGRSARVVPNSFSDLNSAQILHNQLTGPTGIELVFIKDGDRTILAQTIAIQDINAYRQRDQERPKRDARVGMLPPKLAQIIVNLAVGRQTDAQVLDVFCGTGVILQEALLMGFGVAGADLDNRMVEYSHANLAWLKDKYSITQTTDVIKAEAASAHWKQPFSSIASETYLGKPFSSSPTPSEVSKVLGPVDQLHRAVLQNIAQQTKPGFRLCLAVPAWRQRQGFLQLPCLDDLKNLGYTRLKFAHAKQEELIYFRDDQFVARELVILVRT